ncbi:MAG TPA: condensation domain-containing protein, partial [Longimicrobiaceae bacterium]
TLFEGPTIAELAQAVEALRHAAIPQLPPVVRVERAGPPPLSFAQERLWFLDQLEPENPFYNVSTAMRLEGALDVRAMERALGEVVRRHEALRTTFREIKQVAVQVIAPFRGFRLPVEDLSRAGEAEARRRTNEELARPFDLEAGPLFRARLLRLGAEEHMLLLTMHHIVTDWWSTGILLRELSAVYAAFREGRESPLPELAVQYADYAVWQREQLQGEMLDRQMAYWKERLDGAPARLELPTDHARPDTQSHRGSRVPAMIGGELPQRLRDLGQREGATTYMVLLAAWQVLLGRYAASDDVVVGTSIAGRTRREIEELIGFFVNTLVLRTDLSGDPTFREVLARVREVTLGAYDHQDVPFEKLVAELQPERSLSHSPLFQVMFTWGNADTVDGGIPGLRTRMVGAEKDTASFEMTLGLEDDASGFRGYLEYSTDLYERATAERMLRHLERVLEQVAADPDVRLSRLDLLDPAERVLVVGEWNRTGDEAGDACIHALFEAQAARTPDAVAVEFEGDAVTFRQLDERANRLARHLARLGVGPEVRVGLCLERSVEMVVAMLAVVKAGGAYVPLDPGYPADRLAFMAGDAGIAVLLTQDRLRDAVPETGARVIAVDAIAGVLAAESGERPEVAVGPRNLAYVIYTSGSTGTPKGVAMEHGALVNHMRWFVRDYGVGPDDRVLQKTLISFDASVWEFHAPLVSGARLLMAQPGGEREPAYLARTVRERGITILQLV